MSADKSIYSYTDSWGNQEHGSAMWQSIKSAYTKRFFFLLLALPFDLLVMPYVFIRRLCGPAHITLLTNKWPKLANALPGKNLLFIGTPRDFVRAILRGAQYFPAAPVYFLNIAGMYCARNNQERFGKLSILIAGKILKLLCNATQFKVIVHSDALPFARAFVIAANSMHAESICIQHGHFYSETQVAEIDGFLCTTNIVRSSVDGELIAAISPNSKIILAPGFFKLSIETAPELQSAPVILLLGEGFYSVDKNFDKDYTTRLQQISLELELEGAKVIFRPHPSERKFNWKGRFSKVDISPIEKVLSQVDAVIGYGSTMLFEAASVDVLAIQVDIHGSYKDGMDRKELKVSHKWINATSLIKLVAERRSEFKAINSIASSRNDHVENPCTTDLKRIVAEITT